MKIAIRYFSRTGNTGKIAYAISEAAGVPAELLDTPIDEPVDILFLGSSVYAAGVDDQVKAFIAGMDGNKVKRVVNFSTAAILPSTYPQIAKLLDAKKIPLDKREFHCRGRFTVMHSSRPNQKDLEDAKKFAKSVLAEQ